MHLMAWKIKRNVHWKTHEVRNKHHVGCQRAKPSEIRHPSHEYNFQSQISWEWKNNIRDQCSHRARSKYHTIKGERESKLQFLFHLHPQSFIRILGLYIISVHTRLPEMNSEIKFRDTRPAASVNRSISWSNSRRGPPDASADQSEIWVRPVWVDNSGPGPPVYGQGKTPWQTDGQTAAVHPRAPYRLKPASVSI